jgi:hypothetical protein
LSLDDRMLAAQEAATPWLSAFVAELIRVEGDLDAAAASVNITVPELHTLREKNKVVRAEWDRALRVIRTMRAQRLEAVAYHDAAFGARKYRFTPTGEPVAHPISGEPYYDLERDHKLVMSLLASLDRETYGPRQVISGPDGGAIQHVHVAATLADIVRISGLLEEGKIPPTEPVGDVLDAEVVDEGV